MLKLCFIVALCFVLWIICFLNTGNDKKNMLGFRSYPKEVQKIVKNDKILGPMVPPQSSLSKILISNTLLFAVLFFVVGFVLESLVGFTGFLDRFLYFLIMGEVLNFFDLVVIDLLWWRNTSRIRFSCAQDKALYQNPTVHINSFLRGIVMYIVVALIVAGVLTAIF